MAESIFADIRAISDLENGIRTLRVQMADAESQIEHTINLYFENFERGLRILEERLRRAEEDLERAEIALERQRNRQVWVEDEDGDGHWEQANCSAEEARVARCTAVRDRCLRDVNACRQMISDARSRRNVHKEKFSDFQCRTTEAIEKIGPVKELVEKHRSITVPSSTISSSRGFWGSFSSSSSVSTSSTSRGEGLSRPRLPMNSNPSFGSKPAPPSERPRSPQNESVNPIPNRPMTEADRPRSPLRDGIRRTIHNTSSFWNDIKKINEDHQNEESNE